MSGLIRLYPRAWRERYGLEFEGLLAERTPSARDVVDIVLAAVDAHFEPQVPAVRLPRRAATGDRLAGAVAMAGGLTWCTAFIVAAITRPDDFGLPIFLALGLMVLSLPGRYLKAFLRPVAIAIVALGVSLALAFGNLLPWELAVLVPSIVVVGMLGPGALALIAARARVHRRGRWLLVALTMPWPIVGGFAVAIGLPATSAELVLFLVLPMGLAWIALGVRLARGIVITPSNPSNAIPLGGPA